MDISDCENEESLYDRYIQETKVLEEISELAVEADVSVEQTRQIFSKSSVKWYKNCSFERMRDTVEVTDMNEQYELLLPINNFGNM